MKCPLKCPLIVILGYSNAGKDTLAKFLHSHLEHLGYKSETVKFVQPFKDTLAMYLGVDRELMEDREYRSTVITELGCTPLELMIRGFTAMPLIHPKLGLYKTKKTISWLIHQGVIPVFTDPRNPEEIRYLRGLADEGHPVISLRVNRPDQLPQESDEYLEVNWINLKRFSRYHEVIENDKVKASLHGKVGKLVKNPDFAKLL
jgi:hypothetical protein